jgi:hypothetical protein
MSMFLFHVLNLGSRAFSRVDLLWAACLTFVLLASAILSARTFLLPARTHAYKVRVYRHLWADLEQVYRELRDGSSFDSALRTRLSRSCVYFVRNSRVVEARDRMIFCRFILALQQLRFVNFHEGNATAEDPACTLSRAATEFATRAHEATQLRSAVWRRVYAISPTH